ncbi:MAG TPA: DUF4912 domain-containing protein [Pyrinomonadaceae bacterium]|nr:DUF4912 domain-containing protein [Pyrinomonadaceae bacterium]
MSKGLEKNNKSLAEPEFIEFIPADGMPSSGNVGGSVETKPPKDRLAETSAPATALEDMSPVFRTLALPELPELAHENRARLQMQTPNRLFFYWSIGSNPFQKLNRALGTRTANYSLVLKLIDLRRDTEQIQPIDAEGSWWFDVEADGEYRAEIGFYAPNRPYVRALFSNTVATPRKSPSSRVDTEADWSVTADSFARVLEVAGFTEDAFDVALAGDDPDHAEGATHAAFEQLVGEPTIDFAGIAADEIRNVMLLLASGVTLENLRWKISPSLFAILQERAESLSSEKALQALKEQFDIEADEIVEEELGSAVFGSSSVNFPRRLKTRRTLPKFQPVSSLRTSSRAGDGSSN